MMDRHTGHGLNHSCDCEFCVTKRDITSKIGCAAYLMSEAVRKGSAGPQSLRAYRSDPYEFENWIWCLRRSARLKGRKLLKQLKEK